MFSLLAHPGFRALWLGQVVSQVGDRALSLALGYFVYRETGSLSATALLALAVYLPGLLFGSFAGVLADCWDRRRVLIVSQCLQGGVMLCLLLAARPGGLWVAYAVTFAELTLSLVALPAGAALLPSLVGEAQLGRANALLAVGMTTARLVGPLLGGALVALGGLHGVVIFDALSFVLAAAFFTSIPPQEAAPAPLPAQTLLGSWRAMGQEWRAGLRVIRAERAIVGVMVVLGLTSLGGTLVDPSYMPFVQSVLGADAASVGLLGSVMGASTLLGGLLAGWAVERFDLRRLMVGGTSIVGVIMLLMYTQSSLGVMFVLSALLGLPMVVSNVAVSTLVQLATPEAYRGRVYGALGTTTAFVGVLATGGAALFGDGLGVVRMLTLAGGITVLAGVAGLALVPGRRSGSGAPRPASGEGR